MCHVLTFLRGALPVDVSVEYRLLCSGMLYPNVVGDWTKCDGARLLLAEPYVMINASTPPDTYPQELVLRFDIGQVIEPDGNASFSFQPDAEIAADVAALLTLICRRLVTVSCKTGERFEKGGLPLPLRDWPTPFVTTRTATFWKPRPSDVCYMRNSVTIKHNQPPPVLFDVPKIQHILAGLPGLPGADAIIRAVRLYALALELIETRWEIAYQLLISAVETVAGVALQDWQPTEEDRISSKANIVKAAREAGLDDSVANDLALEASKDNPWSRRKFYKFVMDQVEPHAACEEDDLFMVPEYCRPKPEGYGKALNTIYSQRSGTSHAGHGFPRTASVGTTSWIPTRAAHEAINATLEGMLPFPPVGWFERVVNMAIMSFLDQSVAKTAIDNVST